MTQQAPLGTGFTASTTARDVIADVRLDGKVAVVTGGYVGVGLETTRALVSAGASVVVPARSLDKAHAALAGVARTEIVEMDLAAPATIDAFADRFLASQRPLHLLCNNAGIMGIALARDARGLELQLETNHVGHFQLTQRLWPALRRAGGARVISLSSLAHMFGPVDLDDPGFERQPYDRWIAYGRSKSANALFALALDERGRASGVRAFSVHPGSVATELARSVPEAELAALRASYTVSRHKTPEEGAATSVWCAVSPALDGMGGVYCEDVDIAAAVPADHRELCGARPWILDRALADRLWAASERWIDRPFAPA